MDTQETQIIDRLKQATNILVTVSNNPTVDQLSAAIGFTLLLNKLGKNATAVFSGEIPSTIEFLKPEETLETNTDSLRDFIIALDKAKAEKLRYKVEDQLVKIFITPYRTPISDKDLEFSQGDFNVEVVVTLGVKEQKDLDQAIASHGRILHDATVMSLATQPGANLGSMNWTDAAASSLCEMVVALGTFLKADVMDTQMATALLTGIVAETDRFSNEKTTSATMQISAKLMAAGANQQLVASQLQAAATNENQAGEPAPTKAKSHKTKSNHAASESADGSLTIDHDKAAAKDEKAAEPEIDQIHIDEHGQLESPQPLSNRQKVIDPLPSQETSVAAPGSRLILEPPAIGGTLTANSQPEALDPSTDPLGAIVPTGPMLSHQSTNSNDDLADVTLPEPEPIASEPELPVFTPPTPPNIPEPPREPNTLSDLEAEVHSPHLDHSSAQAPETTETTETNEVAHVDSARDAVSEAVIGTTPQILEPVQSLNAQPVDLNLNDLTVPDSAPVQFDPSQLSNDPTSNPLDAGTGLPSNLVPPDAGLPPDDTASSVTDPTAPPPVPPPMMPPTMPPPSDSSSSSTTPL